MDSSASLTAGQVLAFGNPAICLLFVLAFLCIWGHERARRYLLLYAASFSLYAVGSLLGALDRPATTWDDLVMAMLHIGSVLLLARGLLVRSGAQVQTSPLTALGIATLPLLAYFHAAQAESWVLALLPLAVVATLGSMLFAAALSDVVTALKRERVTDPLTQLMNRRNFEELSYGGVQRYPEYPSCLILLDLDNFKHINDTYGHTAGDTALAEVGRIIRHCTRNGDMAWRLGGDEFAILMPGTSTAGAIQAADRIRARLAQTTLRLPLGAFNLTASFGVAQSRVGEPLYDLFARTDLLLYAAKRQGRDRTEAASEAADAAPASVAAGKPEEMLSS